MGAEYKENTMVLTGTVLSVGTAQFEGVAIRTKTTIILGSKVYFTNVLLLQVPGVGKVPVHTGDVLKQKNGDYNRFAPGQTVRVNAVLESTYKNGRLVLNVQATAVELVYTTHEQILIDRGNDPLNDYLGHGVWGRAINTDGVWMFVASVRPEYESDPKTALQRAIDLAVEDNIADLEKKKAHNALQEAKRQREEMNARLSAKNKALGYTY